jgi:SAM-dependent methyltransferase
LSLATREEALGFPRGEIQLNFCQSCGFIYNSVFDESLIEYSERYDPTQAFSGTFNRWHQQLAESLVDRYNLRGKRIVEIGCGKGEFLTMLCELGPNSGVGFDPAVTFERTRVPRAGETRFIQDFYSEQFADQKCDFVCCKMTLEHIAPTADFVGTVRRAVGDDARTTVFFQVPDVLRILKEQVFVDIYYEHCNYFSAGSLARLFRRAGFAVESVARDYDDQYLMIDCRPAGDGVAMVPLPEEHDLDEIAALVNRFEERLPNIISRWQQLISRYRADGRRVVIWGAGSKGVAFLTTLGLGVDEVEFAVDINPHRDGCYMATTGQEIIGPSKLRQREPDVVIVMNQVYKQEVEAELESQGLNPEVLTV